MDFKWFEMASWCTLIITRYIAKGDQYCAVWIHIDRRLAKKISGVTNLSNRRSVPTRPWSNVFGNEPNDQLAAPSTSRLPTEPASIGIDTVGCEPSHINERWTQPKHANIWNADQGFGDNQILPVFQNIILKRREFKVKLPWMIKRLSYRYFLWLHCLPHLFCHGSMVDTCAPSKDMTDLPVVDLHRHLGDSSTSPNG